MCFLTCSGRQVCKGDDHHDQDIQSWWRGRQPQETTFHSGAGESSGPSHFNIWFMAPMGAGGRGEGKEGGWESRECIVMETHTNKHKHTDTRREILLSLVSVCNLSDSESPRIIDYISAWPCCLSPSHSISQRSSLFSCPSRVVSW